MVRLLLLTIAALHVISVTGNGEYFALENFSDDLKFFTKFQSLFFDQILKLPSDRRNDPIEIVEKLIDVNFGQVLSISI